LGAAGDDAAVRQPGEPADIAVADLAEQRDAAVGEQLEVGDLVGDDPDGGELRQVHAIEPARVAGRDERGLRVEQQQVEDRIRRQRDAGRGLAVAHEIQPALGRGAGEHAAVGQPEQRENLRVVELGELAGGVGVFRLVERDLVDPPLGTGAHEPLGRVGRGLEAPEQVGGRGAGQLGQDRAGDEAAVHARRQALQVAARDVAVEIDVKLLGERVGGEGAGQDNQQGEAEKRTERHHDGVLGHSAARGRPQGAR